jgi:hypothetical protein
VLGLSSLTGLHVTEIFQLRQSERIVLDRACVDEILREHGRARGEVMVAETVGQICGLLREVEDQLENLAQTPEAMADIVPKAREASVLCTQIGLVSLGRVARDLGIAALCRDGVALKAIWGRMVRTGDVSLSELWQSPGLSM